MSDYRFQIVKRGDLPCLHVMIDHAELDANGEEIIQTHIPLGDILAAITRYRKQEAARRSEDIERIMQSDIETWSL